MTRKALLVLLSIACVVVPFALGLAGFFLAAFVSDAIPVLVLLGLVASFLAALALTSAHARLRLGRWPERKPYAFAAGLAAVLMGIAMAVLFVRPTLERARVPDRGAAFEEWQLDTGSRLAVTRFRGAESGVPVVYLHGGPGALLRASDITFFRALSEQGFDVVLFDQAGGGASAPLEVGDYTLERAIADLEAIRARLGAERMSLIGQSWGGRLAYEYWLKHPTRIERLIFSSPGPLLQAHTEFDVKRTAARDGGAPSFPPYFFATLVLANINLDAALAFTSREQLNDTMATVMRDGAARGFCFGDPAASTPAPLSGGFDAYQMVTLRAKLGHIDAMSPTLPPPPALLLRGECDYIAWAAARQYRDWLKAVTVFVKGAPHAIWPSRSAEALDAISKFLRGETASLAHYAGEADPAEAAN